MSLLISIFTVLAGLAFGSFLNVCISRLPHHQSIVAPRSRCPQCHTPIRGRDNIPLLSWLLLRARCRDCGGPISARYPAVEAVTAALFLLCLLRFGLTLQGIGAAVLCWLLLGLAATDAETMLLPDAFTLPGLVLGIVASGLKSGNAFSLKMTGASVLWAAAAAAIVLLIRGLYWLVRRREGLGLGDAKLLAMIAAWLGPAATSLTFFLGVLAAALYAVLLAMTRDSSKEAAGKLPLRLPLGSFLSAAAIFTAFHGRSVLDWYFGFFR